MGGRIPRLGRIPSHWRGKITGQPITTVPNGVFLRAPDHVTKPQSSALLLALVAVLSLWPSLLAIAEDGTSLGEALANGDEVTDGSTSAVADSDVADGNTVDRDVADGGDAEETGQPRGSDGNPLDFGLLEDSESLYRAVMNLRHHNGACVAITRLHAGSARPSPKRDF